MILLATDEWEFHNKLEVCYICKKGFTTYDSNKEYYKVKDHCHYTGKYRGAAHNICNLRYRTPKEIPVLFHNGSIYDYHFIIKELADEFEGEFGCLGENTEKYITFQYQSKKEIRKKDKDGNDKTIKMSYKINSFRFMPTSLSNLVDNLSESLHNNRCLNCKSCLDYMTTKDEQLIFKCSSCKENYEKDLNKELIKRFPNTHRVCNKNLDKFILLLRKGVYPYEYMDNWERFDETLLPNKEAFYSNLNMKDITDTDYRHANKVFKEFELENLGEYHDLYVQSNVFENFRNACIKEYKLGPANFLTAPGLAWEACLRKTDAKLELLTDFDMLLMVEEGIRGGMCHAINKYAKANNKYMKNHNEKEESSYIQYLDANNLCGWAMSQRLPVSGFKWVEDVFRIDEEFIKNYDEGSDKGHILEVDVKYPKKLYNLHSDLSFLPERMKIDKCTKLVYNLYNKENYVVNIRALKQALMHGLKLEKVHRIIQFNHEAWLKPYIDMNTELRK